MRSLSFLGSMKILYVLSGSQTGALGRGPWGDKQMKSQVHIAAAEMTDVFDFYRKPHRSPKLFPLLSVPL